MPIIPVRLKITYTTRLYNLIQFIFKMSSIVYTDIKPEEKNMLTTHAPNDKWVVEEFAGFYIRVRRDDGYLSATDMCQVNNRKHVKDYLRLESTKEFIDALEDNLREKAEGRILPTPLIHKIKGGIPNEQGTWIHPQVAVNMAMWISPAFGVKVSDWVLRFMRGDISLVKDIVERHDAVNNTTSEVFINTRENELLKQIDTLQEQNKMALELVGSFREQVNTLQNTVNTLQDHNTTLKEHDKSMTDTVKVLKEKIEHINKQTCQYCNKHYSSPGALTTHIRKHCDDNKKRKFRMALDYEKTKLYFNLFIDDWDTLNVDPLTGTPVYDFKLQKVDWESDNPRIKYIKNNTVKYYSLNRNDSRSNLIKLFNKPEIVLDVPNLLDEASRQMLDENLDIINNYKHLINNSDSILMREAFWYLLNPTDGDPVDDFDF